MGNFFLAYVVYMNLFQLSAQPQIWGVPPLCVNKKPYQTHLHPTSLYNPKSVCGGTLAYPDFEKFKKEKKK